MTEDVFSSDYPAGDGKWFGTTHWSVVLAAGELDSAVSRRALETLCCAYWPPLYAYVRRAGHPPEEAQDLTQEFFARLLERKSVEKADPARGRFRSFLLTSLKHFLVNEWIKAGRQKRGERQQVVSLDGQLAEQRYSCEPSDPLSPDKIFERQWATTLLDRVLRLLEVEYQASGKGRIVQALKDYVWGERGGTPYAAVAAELEMTEGAVKVNVHRLRQRFRELLRLEIAQTVGSPAEVDQELAYLISVMSG